jgi:hypothetical protein
MGSVCRENGEDTQLQNFQKANFLQRVRSEDREETGVERYVDLKQAECEGQIERELAQDRVRFRASLGAMLKLQFCYRNLVR